MKNFFLALFEIIVLLSFPLIAWLMVKFPNYIIFIYAIFAINIILFHFLKSSFLEILTLVLSVFVGMVVILLLPYSTDRILISLEMLGLIASYFILFKLDENYERQKTLLVEKKENFEKEVSLLKIDLEKMQEEIYNNIVRIQNYKSLEEIVSKLSSFNDIKQLKKFLNEVFKNLLPNSVSRLYLSEENIKKDEENIDNILIDYCIKEGGLFYLPQTTQWVEEKCDNLQLKKYLQKRKVIKSIFCIKLESPNEQKILGYIVCYSENYISEDTIRLISLLSTYVSMTISNIYLINYMEELAITDSLTGLYVQRYFKELLTEEIKIARHYNRELSLAIFDIDNFKQINDAYGHNAGDEVLIKFASILKTRLRETDIISRYGGDEFAVIFPDTENTSALGICEKIRNIVENEVVVIPKELIKKEEKSGSVRIKFFVSCGVCGFSDKFSSAM
ncbi:MAG: GGDEF domain-containing protein, partial [Endomicrobiia bacterium]